MNHKHTFSILCARPKLCEPLLSGDYRVVEMHRVSGDYKNDKSITEDEEHHVQSQ